jgi:hypothetical protein
MLEDVGIGNLDSLTACQEEGDAFIDNDFGAESFFVLHEYGEEIPTAFLLFESPFFNDVTAKISHSPDVFNAFSILARVPEEEKVGYNGDLVSHTSECDVEEDIS